MTSKEAIKIRRMELKAAKEAQQLQVLQQVVASPVFQMVGPVVLAEVLESAGILSGRLAGAIEGGVITMAGLRALKDYGIIGAGMLGVGVSAGSLIGLGNEGGSDAERGLRSGFLESIPGYTQFKQLL